MKLLLVFISALVLVAYGNVTPSEVEDKVYPIKPELVAGYADDDGQEADSVENTADEEALVPESEVYVPSVSRACNNAACANVCHRLGFRYGQCTSPSTCWCHH